MKMKLYGTARSPYAARCRMHIYAKGLPIEIIDVDDSLPPAERFKFNPAGKIPFLVDGDQVIVESDVICEYLEGVYPEPRFLPCSPQESARVRSLARFSDEYVLKRALSLLPLLKSESLEPGDLEASLSKINQGIGWLNGLAQKDGPFIAGGAMSLADSIAVPSIFAATFFGRLLGVSGILTEFETVERYWKFIQVNDSAERIIQEMTDAISPYFPLRN